MKLLVTICVLISCISIAKGQTATKLDFLKIDVSTNVLGKDKPSFYLCKPVLGAVCKIENKQSNNKLFTYRARLGTLDYVNRLEYPANTK